MLVINQGQRLQTEKLIQTFDLEKYFHTLTTRQIRSMMSTSGREKCNHFCKLSAVLVINILFWETE